MKTIYSYCILYISPLTGAYLAYNPSHACNTYEEAEKQMKDKCNELEAVVSANVIIQSVNI